MLAGPSFPTLILANGQWSPSHLDRWLGASYTPLMGNDAGFSPSLAQRSPYAAHRVLVADRNVITRVGIRAILERHSDTAVVAEANNYASILDGVDEHSPNVLLIDLDLGDDTNRGLSLCAEVVAQHSETKVIILATSINELVIIEAIRAGASGYLVKDEVTADELSRAVRSVVGGEQVFGPRVTSILAKAVSQPVRASQLLTDRERSVVTLVAQGLSNKEIGTQLFISAGTVKFHLHNCFEKLNVHTRAELVARATDAKLI